MPSGVDEQPPGRPRRPRPQPARRAAPPARAAAGARRRDQAPPPPRRRRPAEDREPEQDDLEPGGEDDLEDGGEGDVAAGDDTAWDVDGAPARTRATRPRPRRRVAAPPKRPRSTRKTVALLTALSVAVVGLGVFAVVLGSSHSSKKAPPPADNTPVPQTTFSDALTGFTVQYPRTWQKIDVPVADYRLAVDGGNNVAFTIRVIPIQEPATAANLENFKAVTDGLVGSNSSVQILKQQAVSLNGMLGYYYFYTFTDGGVSAVHAHYFLFSGNKMNVLVFQALPDDFTNMAPTFDQIADSFRSDPNVNAPVPTTTTSTSVP